MHTYYAENKDKLKKETNKMLSLIRSELEEASGKKYDDAFAEIWTCYETEMLERFPYIGGKRASGTRNLTGAYGFVAMGEVLKRYGVTLEETGHLMVLAYERMTMKVPWIVRKNVSKLCTNTKLLNLNLQINCNTVECMISNGVRYPRRLRGLRLSLSYTICTSSAAASSRGLPFGKYSRSRPLAFSLQPRCHGWRGNAK